MSTIESTPLTLAKIKELAKNYAKKTNQVVIIYRDYDFDFPVYSYCSEKIYDIMCDNNEAEYNWIIESLSY